MKIFYSLIGMAVIASTALLVHKTNDDQRFDYSWLQGSWVGDGFGGTSEEIWSAPSKDGKMMGVYRHHNNDGSLNFYEFLVMDQNGMYVKHFTPGLKGWEEKEDYITFEMIRYDQNIIEMKGATYELISNESMEIHLSMKDENDGTKIETLHMSRKP